MWLCEASGLGESEDYNSNVFLFHLSSFFFLMKLDLLSATVMQANDGYICIIQTLIIKKA